jgi:predicted phosphodiesterase
MRYLVLGDIHGNLEALRAVLAHASRRRFERILFLGDAVGYGASPNQVIRWLRSLGPAVELVRGNHDRVCAGLDSMLCFNRSALTAALWTHEHLDPENLEYLTALPSGPAYVSDEIVSCHGSTVDEDSYILSVSNAQAAFAALPHRVIFFGHTHVPAAFVVDEALRSQPRRLRLPPGGSVIDVKPGRRYLVNPGSVGQPRDRDPRASYAIFDDDLRQVYLHRVSYRVKAARRRMRKAGLPLVLGDRLLRGA